MFVGDRRSRNVRVEWPTVGLAVLVYAAFGLTTWFYHDLPWWAILPLGAYIVALHGSLMHEAVHGHPTNRRGLNELIVFPSLWLWLPFRLYRRTHLTHHRDEGLTDPLQDPESNYVTPAQWASFGPLKRAFWRARCTLAGRMLLVPLSSCWETVVEAVTKITSRNFEDLKAWGLHVVGLIPVLYWAIVVCQIPILEYILLFAYPGLALTVVRSFLEHQARPEQGHRTAIVEAGPLMSLLFLNNNLHVVHHARPELAWYQLPAAYRAEKDKWLKDNGGYCIKGYGAIFAKYLFRAKEPVQHPLA
ncbi:MAG: fatty acid desaturase [Pseudomonadota bacterium]